MTRRLLLAAVVVATLVAPGSEAATRQHTVVPKVTGVSADSHTVGSAVTIRGSGLADVTSVVINSAQASFDVVSPNEITAKIPAAADPTGTIRVAATGGQAATSELFRVRPTIGGFSPAHATAGTTIRIGGTGFSAYAVIRFAGHRGQITDSSHTAIKVIVPIDARSGAITVSTSGGVATSAGQFTLVPKITSVSPAVASAGATVKVLGSGLAETSRVVFAGDAAATIVSKRGDEVDAVVPSAARNGRLTLTASGGTASSPSSFRLRPKVSDISADSHTAGSAVTIHGSGLADVTSVEINSAQAGFHVVSPNEITAKIPADADPTGNILVFAPGGGQATASSTFRVRPTISGFSPASAAAGASIRITGTGFSAYAVVRFQGGSTGQITDSSHTAIKVIVPFSAQTGPIAVNTSGGMATSAGTFTSIGPPDFMLTAGPATQTVSRGGQTTFTIYLTPSHGFSSPVQLSLSGSPLGSGHRPFLVSTFSPNPAAAVGSSSTLTIKTDVRIAKGTYVLTITGSSGSQSHTVQVSLAVQ